MELEIYSTRTISYDDAIRVLQLTPITIPGYQSATMSQITRHIQRVIRAI